MEWLQGFFADYGVMLAQETWNTILMMLVPTAVAYLVGIPIGVLLLVSAPGGLRPHRVLNAVLGWIVNIGRSIPFVIFIVVLIPATRIVMARRSALPARSFRSPSRRFRSWRAWWSRAWRKSIAGSSKRLKASARIFGRSS